MLFRPLLGIFLIFFIFSYSQVGGDVDSEKLEQGEPTIAGHIGLALAETAKGNYEKARQHYIFAVLIEPNLTLVYQNLGLVLLKLNRLDEADAAFQTVIEQDRKVALAYFGRGQVASKRRDFQRACNFYKKAIEVDPKNPAFYYALAQSLLRLKDQNEAQKAIAQYRRAKSELYLQESRQLLKKEEWREALSRLQKSVEADPTYLEAAKERAYVQMRLGDFDAAKRSYEQILILETNLNLNDLLEVRSYLGIVEAQLGNINLAESIFLDTIRQFPDFMDNYLHLAQLQETKGDLAEAEATFDMGIQKQPNWAPGYWWRGQIRYKRNNIPRAESDFRLSIKLSPNTPFPKNSLAKLLAEERRNLDEALKLVQAAMREEPTPEHRATLAFVYHKLKRTKEAQSEIERAYREDPNNPEIRTLRAKILNLPLLPLLPLESVESER